MGAWHLQIANVAQQTRVNVLLRCTQYTKIPYIHALNMQHKIRVWKTRRRQCNWCIYAGVPAMLKFGEIHNIPSKQTDNVGFPHSQISWVDKTTNGGVDLAQMHQGGGI